MEQPEIPQQKLSPPTGHTLAGFVEHDHDLSHWCIHHQLCPLHTLNAHPYPHRGTGQLYHNSGRSSLSLRHPPMIEPRRRTINRAPTLHLGGAPSQSSRDLSRSLFPIQASKSPARHQASPSRGPQPSLSRGRGKHFAPTQGIPHRSRGQSFQFHEFTNPLGINTLQGIHVPERIKYTSTPPQQTLKPTASSCSLGQLENEYVQEGRDKDLLWNASTSLSTPFHRTSLASVKVLLCSCRSPQ